MESLLAPSQLEPPALAPGQPAPMAGHDPRRYLPCWHSLFTEFLGEGETLGYFLLLASHLQASGSRSRGLTGAPQALH